MSCLGAAQVPSIGDLVPALEADTAVGGGGVLGYEKGVAAVGVCLPSWYGSAGASRLAMRS